MMTALVHSRRHRDKSKKKKIKKDICKVFSDDGLKITIEANEKNVKFLDVTLNLSKGSYEPYLKPNNTPPSIIKNVASQSDT